MSEIAEFQVSINEWMLHTFGEAIAVDGEERNWRFLEEAIELVQACNGTAEDAHKLVDYVFSRPIGEKHQEVGGVIVTLAALCNAHYIPLDLAAHTELARIWKIADKIREKQKTKPLNHSPLPGAYPGVSP